MGVLTMTAGGELRRMEQTSGADRRAAPRRALHEIPQISQVKMLSQPVKVVNVSRTGLLMNSTSRLIPGRRTRLRFEGPSLSTWVPSRIARCEVGSLEGGKIVYIVGVVFETPLAFVDDRREESRPPAGAQAPSIAPAFGTPLAVGPAANPPAFDTPHIPAPAVPAFVETLVMNDW